MKRISLAQNTDRKNLPQSIDMKFYNIRFEDKFEMASNQMIRFYDMMAKLKGQPQENPEWKAI